MKVVKSYSKENEISLYDMKKSLRTLGITLLSSFTAAVIQILPQVQEYFAGEYELDGAQLLIYTAAFSALYDAIRRMKTDYSNDGTEKTS